MKSSLSKIGAGLKTGFTVGAAAIGTATTAMVALGKASVQSYAQLEQLEGGAKKIFNDMDYDTIKKDAQAAWKTMNLSVKDYLDMINSVGATFSSTMGDQKGYETAKKGMQAIADYASGTGANLNTLNEKYKMITRSTTSYLSIADQFSGILPQTTTDFLAQAQSAGFLSEKYKALNEVPIAEYQEAITAMLEKGVGEMGLLGNTAAETTNTITGSIAGLKASWDNFLNGSGSLGVVLKMAVNVVKNVGTAVQKLIPDILENISEWLPDIVDEAEKIVTALAQGIVDNLDQVLNCGIAIVEALSRAITNVLPNVTKTAVKMVANIAKAILSQLPLILDCGLQMIIELAKGIIEELPSLLEMIPTIIEQMSDVLIKNLPQLLEVSLKLILTLIEGLTKHIDKMTKFTPTIIQAIVDTLMNNMDTLIPVAIQVIIALITGLIQALPQLIMYLPTIIYTIYSTLLSHMPEIIQAGAQLILGLIQGIGSKIWEVGQKAWEIGDKIREKIEEWIGKAWQWGVDLVQGLMDGMNSKKPAVAVATTSLMGVLKSFIHFSKPDRGPMRDYEKWMPDMVQGLADSLDKSSPLLEHEALKVAQRLKNAVAFNTSELSNSLTGTGTMAIQRNAEITATLSSIDNDREITVNAVTNLDGRVLTQTVNKVNARQKLAYGF